jgi:hypothetical protein
MCISIEHICGWIFVEDEEGKPLIMRLRYARFIDPAYSVERFVEFDAADVVAVEQRQISLLMRGKFWATYVTLKNGNEYSLDGRVGDEIEAARRQARSAVAVDESASK